MAHATHSTSMQPAAPIEMLSFVFVLNLHWLHSCHPPSCGIYEYYPVSFVVLVTTRFATYAAIAKIGNAIGAIKKSRQASIISYFCYCGGAEEGYDGFITMT